MSLQGAVLHCVKISGRSAPFDSRHFCTTRISYAARVHQGARAPSVVCFFKVYPGGNPQPEAIGHTLWYTFENSHNAGHIVSAQGGWDPGDASSTQGACTVL